MMNRAFIRNNLIDENGVPAIAAIDCADVKAVLVAHYEASAKSDYNDSIGASISAVTSMSHTLTTGSNSFENKVCNAAAISDFKMSIGRTSAIPPIEDVKDDHLQCPFKLTWMTWSQ
jgi:hypothetical protein